MSQALRIASFLNSTNQLSIPQTSRGVYEDTPFNWTVEVESSIDSSYFAGYLITQVPGGFLASMYPANRIFGAAIAASAIFNMAIPGAMSIGPTAVVLLKIAQGFVEVCAMCFLFNGVIFSTLICNVPNSSKKPSKNVCGNALLTYPVIKSLRTK